MFINDSCLLFTLLPFMLFNSDHTYCRMLLDTARF